MKNTSCNVLNNTRSRVMCCEFTLWPLPGVVSCSHRPTIVCKVSMPELVVALQRPLKHAIIYRIDQFRGDFVVALLQEVWSRFDRKTTGYLGPAAEADGCPQTAIAACTSSQVIRVRAVLWCCTSAAKSGGALTSRLPATWGCTGCGSWWLPCKARWGTSARRARCCGM